MAGQGELAGGGEIGIDPLVLRRSRLLPEDTEERNGEKPLAPLDRLCSSAAKPLSARMPKGDTDAPLLRMVEVSGSLAAGFVWNRGCGTIFIWLVTSVSDLVLCCDAEDVDGWRYCSLSREWYSRAIICASVSGAFGEGLSYDVLEWFGM